MISGTYYVVPYTTGCKFTIAEQPDGAVDQLYSHGQLSPKALVAIREIHERFDVDLDQTLSDLEFQSLVHDLTRRDLVCCELILDVCLLFLLKNSVFFFNQVS